MKCQTGTSESKPCVCPACGADATRHSIRLRSGRKVERVSCPACREKAVAAREKATAEFNIRKLEGFKNHSGIEGALQARSFDNWKASRNQQKAIKNQLVRWARDYPGPDRPWLAFVGTTGTGKSHLGLAIANRILEEHGGHMAVRYLKLVGMMRGIRSTYGGKSEVTEERMVRMFQRVGLLILDEFGTREKLSDWEGATLDDILDSRWEQRRPTIIISNITSKEFFAMAGQRVESRFADLGRIINFTWPDYRVENRKESGNG